MDSASILSNYLRRQSRLAIFVQAALLIIFIGWIDTATGYEVAIFPFYSIPILLLVWRGDVGGAIAASVLSALAWWVADAASGHVYSRQWLSLWDTIVRLIFFCLVVIAGTALKSRGDANRVQIDLLERSHRLEEEIVGISEREQQRLGRDLHDGLCQFLASIGFAADGLASRLAQEAPRCAEPARQLVGLLEEAVIRTRGLARGLSPVDRDEGGLESALEELAESTSRLVGISCVFIAEAAEESGVLLENHRAVDVFRIAQEAVGNALKHSHARQVVIALEASEETLALRVSDDGAGFDESTADRKGMGLNIMRYRARRAGGALEVFRNSPEGTVVSCTIQRVPAEPADILETTV